MAFNAGTITSAIILSGKGFYRESKKITKAMTAMAGAAARVGAMVGAMGAALKIASYFAARSFIQAANAVEQYQLRLSAAMRSAEEGRKIFKDLAKFAGEVPFELEHITDAAAALSGVMKGGRLEVMKWMPVISDLSAFTQLSFRETAMQVQRMYSAGAGAADLFRERGVTAMMGFRDGVKHSIQETRRVMMEAWTKADSQFRGLSEKMAETWTGILSMMKDSWFIFRVTVMDDTGFFRELKIIFKTTSDYIIENRDAIKKWVVENKKFIRSVVLSTGALGALAVTLGGLLLMLPGIAIAIKALASPLFLVIAALASLRVMWKRNFMGFRDDLEWLGRYIRDIIWPTIRDTLTDILKHITWFADKTTGLFVGLASAVRIIFTGLLKELKGMYGWIWEAYDSILVLQNAANKIDKLAAVENLVKVWAGAGRLAGESFHEQAQKAFGDAMKGEYVKSIVPETARGLFVEMATDLKRVGGNLWKSLKLSAGDFGDEWMAQIKDDMASAMDATMEVLREKAPALHALMSEIHTALTTPKGTRTPAEWWQEEGRRLMPTWKSLGRAAYDAGELTARAGERGAKGMISLAKAFGVLDDATITVEKALKKLNDTMAERLDKYGIETTAAVEKEIRALRNLQKLTQSNAYEQKQITEGIKSRLEDLGRYSKTFAETFKENVEQALGSIQSSYSSLFVAVVSGAESGSDAMRDFAQQFRDAWLRAIGDVIAEMLIAQQMMMLFGSKEPGTDVTKWGGLVGTIAGLFMRGSTPNTGEGMTAATSSMGTMSGPTVFGGAESPATQSGGGGDITIINALSAEGIASAMAMPPGQRVIINVIGEDISRGGPTVKTVQRYA